MLGNCLFYLFHVYYSLPYYKFFYKKLRLGHVYNNIDCKSSYLNQRNTLA